MQVILHGGGNVGSSDQNLNGEPSLTGENSAEQLPLTKLCKIGPKYLHNILTPNTNTKGRHKDNLFVVRPNTNWLKNSFTYRERDSVLRNVNIASLAF